MFTVNNSGGSHVEPKLETDLAAKFYRPASIGSCETLQLD